MPAAATSESVNVDLPTVSGCEQGARTNEHTVVDVSDDAHVTDVVLLVHQGTQLVDRELHHRARVLDANAKGICKECR